MTMKEEMTLKMDALIVKTARNEKGMILLTVLILIFISTLLGVIALNSTNVEIQISGYEKRVSNAFSAAEAGVDLGVLVIENTLKDGTLAPLGMTIFGKPIAMDTIIQLGGEINDQENAYDEDTVDRSDANFAPDLAISDFKGVAVNVDIDRLFLEVLSGNAMEMAMGYEGRGTGAASGGVSIYYRIASAGEN